MNLLSTYPYILAYLEHYKKNSAVNQNKHARTGIVKNACGFAGLRHITFYVSFHNEIAVSFYNHSLTLIILFGLRE